MANRTLTGNDKYGIQVYRDGVLTFYSSEDLEQMAMWLKVNKLVPYPLIWLLKNKARLVTMYFAHVKKVRKANAAKNVEKPKVYPNNGLLASIEDYIQATFGKINLNDLSEDEKEEFYSSLFYKTLVN